MHLLLELFVVRRALVKRILGESLKLILLTSIGIGECFPEMGSDVLVYVVDGDDAVFDDDFQDIIPCIKKPIRNSIGSLCILILLILEAYMSRKLPQSEIDKYKGRLKDSLYWWLGRKKPFIINGEYKIELLHIDRNHYSAKIRITNLKNGDSVEEDMGAE